MLSTLTSNEKVFKSLNCAKCEKPFSTDPSRTPRRLGLVKPLWIFWFQNVYIYICRECFDCEKVKKEEKRWIFQFDEEDFCNFDTVKYLLELSADDSLQLNESKTGYIIVKEPFVSPECPVCFETYEIVNPMKCPFDLDCHHTICIGCYCRMRTDDKDKSREYVFQIVCPMCQKITSTSVTETCENGLKNFLRELPGMIEQYNAMKALRVTEVSAQCLTCPKKIQLILDEYRERFAKMDQELEEKLKEFEKKFIANMERMK